MACQTDTDELVATSRSALVKAQALNQSVRETVADLKAQKEKFHNDVQTVKAENLRLFEVDLKNAQVRIVDHGRYLTCALNSTGRPFAVLHKMQLGVTWFVDHKEVTRAPAQCHRGGTAGLGVGVGTGGGQFTSCEAINGPHDRDGFYPYMAPEVRSEQNRFTCRMSFAPSITELATAILTSKTLTYLKSEPFDWPNWPRYMHQRQPWEK